MYEWKFKYSRAIFFGICFFILLIYIVLVFIPEASIVDNLDEEPTRIKSTSELKENYHKMVEIEYEYGFSALYMRGNYFVPNRDYGVLKLMYGNELVICSSPGFIEDTLKDGFYVANNVNKIVPKADGNTYVLRGYVDSIGEEDQRMLKKQIQTIYDTREMPDSNENINFGYVIQILNLDTEKENQKKQVPLLICLAFVFIFSLIILINEIFRYKKYSLDEDSKK